MRLLIPLAVLSLILTFSASRSTEAPTGFDNKSNGVADDATHQADQTKFEEVEQLSDGLGPLYNCLLYTSPSPRDRQKSRMPSSA